ncbi:MAG: hypothetical protein U0169_21700 [Polyangiaceae bacterium]
MAKKQVTVSLRKPPPPADLEAFIQGRDGQALAASRPSDVRDLGTPIVASPAGREFREMVLYLPEDLTRKVRLHCVDADRDVSNLIADVLREHLEVRERATLDPALEDDGTFGIAPALSKLRARVSDVKDALRTRIRFLRPAT